MIATKNKPKIHHPVTSFGKHASGEGIGVCGFTGKVSKDWNKVTCKFCKTMRKKHYV